MGDITNDFSHWEFECPCGCFGQEMNLDFINTLQTVRNEFGERMTVTSGYRCKEQNKKVGGGEDSAHLKGIAADISMQSDELRGRFLPVVYRYFDRVGIYEKHIHLDDDDSKERPRTWVG